MKNSIVRIAMKFIVYFFSIMFLIVAIALLIAFLVTFWGPVSEDLTEWYEWGSFLSFLVSLINLVCFLLLTYRAYLFQEDSYDKQMQVQKIELETSFRKSHIDDVRAKLVLLEELPSVKFNVQDSYDEFARKCYSLIRIFSIYQNVNADLFKGCDYSGLNAYLSDLKVILDDIESGKKQAVKEAGHIEAIIGEINGSMINLEKSLSDYTLKCVNDAF